MKPWVERVGVYRSPALEVNRIVAKWRLPGELPVTVRANSRPSPARNTFPGGNHGTSKRLIHQLPAANWWPRGRKSVAAAGARPRILSPWTGPKTSPPRLRVTAAELTKPTRWPAKNSVRTATSGPARVVPAGARTRSRPAPGTARGASRRILRPSGCDFCPNCGRVAPQPARGIQGKPPTPRPGSGPTVRKPPPPAIVQQGLPLTLREAPTRTRASALRYRLTRAEARSRSGQ